MLLIAAAIAFAMAAGMLFAGVTGPPVLLPLALIPLCAGIGILRKKVWSAYGFGLFLFVQSVIAVLRGFSIVTVAVAGFSVALGVLFFIAGKKLARAGGSRQGHPLGWIAISVMLSAPLLFVRDFAIPTDAMANTILRGDRILVQRFPVPEPGRGDLIVFVYPIDRRQTFVKRVVGVGGDRIRISDKVLYRNGIRIDEPYAIHTAILGYDYRDNFPSRPYEPLYRQAIEMLERHVVNGEVVVPDKSYFVLGDNRDSSLDSRYWGFIGRGDVIGKPILVYDSDDRTEDEAKGGLVFRPEYTRWDRIFRLL